MRTKWLWLFGAVVGTVAVAAACSSASSPGSAPGSDGGTEASGSGSGSTSSGSGSGAGSSGSSSGASSSGSSSGGGSGSGSSSGSSSGSGGDSGSNPACPGADATEFALVEAWLENTTAAGALPDYAYTNIAKNFPAGAAFDKLACSIAMSCVEWAPMETHWLRQCEAVLTSAIVAESSYDPSSVVTDSYATRKLGDGTTAADPTVGLLQIRFSSTVHDFNYYGAMPKMAAIGCSWPPALASQADSEDFWGTQGATASDLTFMQDPACNVALASWYYFYNATGNGGSNVVWIDGYCAGNGVGGTMVDGLLSHLEGGSYPRPADDTNPYPWGIECCASGSPSDSTCTGCTGRFAAFMGIGTSASRPSPDPFLETLAPEPSKYCK